MDAVTLQPAAGAQGEFTGILIIRAYHRARGDSERDKILVPDSAHGTNPATAALAGFKMVIAQVGRRRQRGPRRRSRPTSSDATSPGMMLTVPNTLGLFEPNILKISELVHKAGGLMYGDGANLNALVGHIRPGDLGFDVMHINLHKTFTTPTAAAARARARSACKAHLAPVPARPRGRQGRRRHLHCSCSLSRVDRPGEDLLGQLRHASCAPTPTSATWACAACSGSARTRSSTPTTCASSCKDTYDLPYDRICMHEVVLSGKNIKRETGIRDHRHRQALIDSAIHPPTVYFPLIVHEALMIEPTETKSRRRSTSSSTR